jgi:peptidoglycan hydrolase-like protein with peptidoglycan-binding domain
VLLQDKVITPYKTLISEGYKPSQIVGMWIQGSSDVNSGVSADKYEANWSTILATIRNAGIDMPIFIARTTHCRLNDGAELELVNQTQRVAKLKTQSIIHDTLGRLPDAKLGTYPGPNLDFIGSSGRHDYCHFNGWGGQVAAELTLQVLLDSVDIIDRVNEPEIPIEYTNTVDDNYVDSNENSDSFIEETTEETSDSVTLSELIELFISLGIIAPDKADAARQTILQPPGTEDNTSCLILKYDLYLGRSDSETDGEVSKLQNFLQQTGDYTYPEITGYYGPSTQEAVQSWQARNGVVSSGSPETTGYGVVGPKTRAAISQNCTTPLKPKIASTFSITLDSDYADNDVRTVRNVIPAAKISTSGSRVRVKFIQNSGTGGRAISNASIVEQNSGAKGATVPTRLTFDNANKVTLVNSAPLWSDWIDFTLDEKKSYLITWDQPGSNTMRGRQKTGSGYGAYSATDQRAMQQSNSGFLLISRDVTIGVSEIEVADSQLDEISGPEAGVGSI